MNPVEDVKKAIEKCEFLIDEECVSGAELLRSFLDFMVNGISEEDKFYGISLHTGSKIFDAAAIVFAAFTNLVNTSDPQKIIRSLCPNDLVVYENKRYAFVEIIPCSYLPGKEAVILAGKDDYKETITLPESSWNQVTPYNGTSTRKDGRGIHRKGIYKDTFYHDVLNYHSSEISYLTDTSSVVLISKSRADIIEHISIRFHGRTVKLLNLITATYYTENNELPFGGNVGQNEPILKLTSKASVARKLIKQKGGNEHIGLIITGNNTISRNYNEIQELTSLRSLKYILILTQIGSEYGPDLLNISDESRLFACTKSFVSKHSIPDCCETDQVMLEFRNQMRIIRDFRNTAYSISSEITWEHFRDFKQGMIQIKRSELSGSDTESFVMNAYSLMNLFLTSVFSIGELEDQIESGIITSVRSPSEKLEDLENQIKHFPKSLSATANHVLEILQECWIMLADKCEKGTALLSLLRQYHDKRIAIIVPKAYFGDVLKNIDVFSGVDSPGKITVVTANQFDHTQMYDIIICSGLIKGRRFDAFRCRSAKNVITLLYDFEKRIYNSQMRKAKSIEELYDLRIRGEKHNSGTEVETPLEYQMQLQDNDREISSMEEISLELDDYISRLQEKADLRVLATSGGNGSALAECIAAAVFENEERCFFTKRYKAYVIDKATGEAEEKDVEKLVEGDSLIFTINNDNTHDIVDDMLQKTVSNLVNQKNGKRY